MQKAEVFSDRPSVPIVLIITRKKGKGPPCPRLRGRNASVTPVNCERLLAVCSSRGAPCPAGQRAGRSSPSGPLPAEGPGGLRGPQRTASPPPRRPIPLLAAGGEALVRGARNSCSGRLERCEAAAPGSGRSRSRAACAPAARGLSCWSELAERVWGFGVGRGEVY